MLHASLMLSLDFAEDDDDPIRAFIIAFVAATKLLRCVAKSKDGVGIDCGLSFPCFDDSFSSSILT